MQRTHAIRPQNTAFLRTPSRWRSTVRGNVVALVSLLAILSVAGACDTNPDVASDGVGQDNDVVGETTLASFEVVDAHSGSEQQPTSLPDLRKATCGSPDHPLKLASHLTEADQEFVERVAALDPNILPREYDTTNLLELDLELIGYMIDAPVPERLTRDQLLSMGLLGKSILLAFGGEPAPVMVDLKELRRGLYHYYNCSRGHPATLEGFVSIYGDYTQWLSLDFPNSFPKIYPRKLWINDELGIYVAETLRNDEVHETEVILSGYRNDGALEFLAYLPNGELTNRGEFRAGASFVAGASPYACMSCHRDPDTGRYTKIFPDLTLSP